MSMNNFIPKVLYHRILKKIDEKQIQVVHKNNFTLKTFKDQTDLVKEHLTPPKIKNLWKGLTVKIPDESHRHVAESLSTVKLIECKISII